MLLSLNHLPIGEKGEVLLLALDHASRRRMIDLGLIEGTMVEALHKSPSGDPTAYSIRGTVIALRKEDTENIIVQF